MKGENKETHSSVGSEAVGQSFTRFNRNSALTRAFLSRTYLIPSNRLSCNPPYPLQLLGVMCSGQKRTKLERKQPTWLFGFRVKTPGHYGTSVTKYRQFATWDNLRAEQIFHSTNFMAGFLGNTELHIICRKNKYELGHDIRTNHSRQTGIESK